MLSRSLETIAVLASYTSDPISTQLNESLKTFTPTEIMMLTLAGYLVMTEAYKTYGTWNTKDIKKRLTENMLQNIKRLPVIGPCIEAEIDEEVFGISDDIKADVDKRRMAWDPIAELPKEGLTKETILKRFETLQDHYHEGKISGAVYTKHDKELQDLLKEVWSKTALTNPMHSEWSLIHLMEAEVLSMCHELLHSPLNKLLKRLEEVKVELKNTMDQAIAGQKEFTLKYAELIARRDRINKTLHDKEAPKDASLLQELKTIRKTLKQISKQAIKADPVVHKHYAPLAKERSELEKKTRNPGIMTHGGSTSIFEACKAHVFRKRENSIKDPVILVPETAHVAFDKAAKVLNVNIIKIPVDPSTGQVDLIALETAIKWHKKNIAVMVGSAPSFLYGVIDPIPELGALAKKYDIPLHVDSCLGGFLTAFSEGAGLSLPSCDFSVPGVSSISIDTHKYGQTPKGTSVLLFHPDCKASTVQVLLDALMGMYVTEGLDGSRSGADIATTWATLIHYGANYYIEEARKIVSLRKEIESTMGHIDGLEIVYEKSAAFKLNVIGIRAKADIDLLLVEKYLKEKNWSIQIMQTEDTKVDGLHFCLTPIHTKMPHFAQDFHEVIKDAFHYARSKPLVEASGNIKIYGKMQGGGVPKFVQQEIGASYIGAHNTIRRPRSH